MRRRRGCAKVKETCTSTVAVLIVKALTENLWPLSGGMKYTKYFDGIVANPIGQDVGEIGYDELSRPRDAPWPPQIRLFTQ